MENSGPKMKTAAVIPAYNTENSLEKVVRDVLPFVDRIIIVDDASTDATGRIAAQLAGDDSAIQVIHHSVNQGVGGSVLSGYRAALVLGMEIVVKVDSDDQMDARNIPYLCEPILQKRADYVKCNRFLHQHFIGTMPFIRRFGNIGLSFLVKIASGYWQIFDPTNGFTAIHTDIIPLLNHKRLNKRYFFESSMLLELGINRAVVVDHYTRAKYADEISHLSELDVLFNFPPKLFLGMLRRILMQYFVLDFNIASLYLFFGGGLMIFGGVFGGYHWLKSLSAGIAAPTGTIMVAALPLIFGFQFILQFIQYDIQNFPKKVLFPLLGLSDR